MVDGIRIFAMSLGAMACLACSGGVDQEGTFEDAPVDQAQEAMWELACYTLPPNVRQNLRFDGSHPAGYGHPDCAKTFIKDAYNIAASGLVYVEVKDNGSVPTNQAACTSLWGSVQLFIWDDITPGEEPQWVPFWTNDYQANGVWVPASGLFPARCQVPIFRIDEGYFMSGYHYRIAATFRTSRHGSTRPLSFLNQYEPR